MPQLAPKYKLGQIVTVTPLSGKVPYQGVIRTMPKIDGPVQSGHNFIYGVYSKSHNTIHPVDEARIVSAEEPKPLESDVPPNFEDMTKAQILDFADANGIEGVDDTMKKSEMIDAIEKFLTDEKE